MIIKRSRRLLIQPRQYEQIEVSAEIEFDPSEVNLTPDDVYDLAQYADETLTVLLAKEVEEAAAASNERSFILDYRYTDTDSHAESTSK